MQISPNLLQVILQVDLRWPLTLICDLWPHEHMKVSIGLLYKQVWFQSDLELFTWGHFHIFSILQLDLRWPLTSLTNEGFPVASITQLWLKSIKTCKKIEPTVHHFSHQTKTGDNRGQSPIQKNPRNELPKFPIFPHHVSVLHTETYFLEYLTFQNGIW